MKTISKALVGTVAAGAMALASATPAMAQDRYRDRDRGIDVGDIIAGALVIGGIAAVAGSIGNDRYRGGTYGEPYYGDRYNSRYNSRYGYNYGGDPRTAVEQCVRAAERGTYRARVTDIRDIDRTRYGYRVKGTVIVNERGSGWDRDYGYRYSGRNYDQGRFTCDVQGNRVVGLDYSGLRNDRYGYGYGW